MLSIVLKKNFFKLMYNTAYGRTMENSRKRVKVRLVNKAKDYTKYESKPSFVSQRYLAKILLLFMKLNYFSTW